VKKTKRGSFYETLCISVYLCICPCHRVYGAAIGVTAGGATNAVTHSSVSPTAWVRLAKMQNRSSLHAVHCQLILLCFLGLFC